MLHVWVCLTDESTVAERARDLAFLSPGERIRHDRLHFDRDRRDFAAAHALVRTVLSAQTGIPTRDLSFDLGEHGKPRLRGSAVSFNLSHSHGIVACAVTSGLEGGGEVGIDVESIDRQVDLAAIGGRYFSAVEQVQLAALPDDDRAGRFFELWTLKEAFIKGLGLGLSHSLNSQTFDLSVAGAIAFSQDEETAAPERWGFALFAPTPRHRLAVAVNVESGVETMRVVANDVKRDSKIALRPVSVSRELAGG